MPDYLSHTLSVLAGINELGQSNANIEATKQLDRTAARGDVVTQAMKKETAEDERGQGRCRTTIGRRRPRHETDAGAPLDAFAGCSRPATLIEASRRQHAAGEGRRLQSHRAGEMA